MKNIFRTLCSLAFMGSALAQTTLIEDDFSSSSIDASISRFRSPQVDTGDWVIRSGANGGNWAIGGNALTNSADVAGTRDDQGAHLMNTVSSTDTSLTKVTVSFDYSVGLGSTPYFQSALFTGAASFPGGTSDPRLSFTAGEYDAGRFNTVFTSALNLKDGLTPTTAADGALVALVGPTSGTFSQSYEISSFPGISSIADISHILAVFTADTETDAINNGAISIGDVSLVAEVGAPLPSAIWDGETDANWATNTNWQGDTLPASLDELIFTGTANTATNNDLAAGTEFNGISFNNTADTESFSLGGNSITLGGDITQSGAAGSITDTISLDMELNGDREVSSGPNHNLEVSGVISEGGSARALTKSGDGTLILTAANTYTGATTINGGILQIGNGGTTGSLSTSSVITNNGDLLFNRSDALTQGTQFSAAAIDGNGALRKWGTNTLTLTAANTYTGRTILGLLDPPTLGGTLNIQHDSALGTGLLDFQDGATFELGVSGLTVANDVTVFNRPGVDLRAIRLDLPGTTAGALTGAIDIRLVLASAFVIEVGTDDTLTMSGVIANTTGGGAGITKVGDGTLIINNITNSYKGNTTVSAGTLSLGDGASDTQLSDSADVIVAAGAVLDLNFTSTDTIRSLFVGDVQVAAGTYDMSDFPEIIGDGSLEVTTSPLPNIISIEVELSGDVVLTLDGPVTGLTVLQSNDLSAGTFVEVASIAGINTLTIDADHTDPDMDGKDFYRVSN